MTSEPVSLVVTGIRVVDLFAPFPRGGSLVVTGDLGSGANVLAMEVMHNLCRRYGATAICRVTTEGPFNEANVRGWVDKLGVDSLVKSIEPGEQALIEITNAGGTVARVLPFAEETEGADAWVTVRRTVLATGRLPGVELQESGSKHLTGDRRALAERVAKAVAEGDEELIKYLGQPFFLAVPWTSTKGEITEPEEAMVRVRAMLA